jgi:hypothetical protein
VNPKSVTIEGADSNKRKKKKKERSPGATMNMHSVSAMQNRQLAERLFV